MSARRGGVCAAAFAIAACHGGAGPRHPASDDGDGSDGGDDEEVVVPAAADPPRAHGGHASGVLAAVPTSALCVTHGKLIGGSHAGIRDASVRADDGICLRHERYLSARASCPDFRPVLQMSS